MLARSPGANKDYDHNYDEHHTGADKDPDPEGKLVVLNYILGLSRVHHAD